MPMRVAHADRFTFSSFCPHGMNRCANSTRPISVRAGPLGTHSLDTSTSTKRPRPIRDCDPGEWNQWCQAA